jgi:preprotein translocase subunit SecB
MEVINQQKLIFGGVDIINIHFEAKKSKEAEMSIHVDCKPLAVIHKNDKNRFSIIMDVDVSSTSFFTLSLRAIGKFKLNEETDETLKNEFIKANAVAIMFPYIRAFVATFTANLGNVTGALSLPTMFFEGDVDTIDEWESKELE